MSKALTVSVSGSHGTGKTTLCRALLQQLSARGACGMCREAPRLIIDETSDEKFFHRENNTLTRQLIIFLFQGLEEISALKAKHDVVVLDRTPVDILAYTFLLNPKLEASEEGGLLKSAVRRWVHSYDLVFKTPIEFPLRIDGVREADLGFQREVDQKIDAMHRDFRIRPVLASGDPMARLDIVMKALERKQSALARFDGKERASSFVGPQWRELRTADPKETTFPVTGGN